MKQKFWMKTLEFKALIALIIWIFSRPFVESNNEERQIEQ